MANLAEKSEIGFWFELILRLILALFFLIAGVLKLIDPKSLTTAIETYQLVPYTASFLLALILPWMEIFAGLGVLLKKCYRGSLLILCGLLIVFIVSLFQGYIRGLDVICGCLGGAYEENQTNYIWLISRDLVLLLFAWTLWIRQSRKVKQI